MKKILFVYIFVYISCYQAMATELRQCTMANTAFKTGEKIEYSAYFRWGILQLSSFSIRSEVKAERYQDQNVYAITATGVTAGNMDRFFTIRDTMYAKIRTNDLRPVYFKELTREQKHRGTREHWYSYTDSTSTVKWQSADSKSKQKSGVTAFADCAYDALSLLYRMRNLDFIYQELRPNQVFGIDYFSDGKSSPLQMRFDKKEIIKLKNGDAYECLKFELEVAEGTLFKNNERVFIWITNDKNRLIAYVEAKLKIGYVKMDLVNVEHHRHPLTAKLKPVK